ncbi:hypothetical protein LR69_01273 [Geobacillus sp. BCO2]|nr:hypothetical protein LR69_01273 [Geobacillus sp. BCO2]
MKRFFRQMRGYFRRIPAERVKIIHLVISFPITLRLTSSGEAIHTLLVATKTLFHEVIPKAVLYAEMMWKGEKSSRSYKSHHNIFWIVLSIGLMENCQN